MSSISFSTGNVQRLEQRQATLEGYRRCIRCVMDTTDPDIEFDEQGICSNCRDFMAKRERLVRREDEPEQQLQALVEKIQAGGRGRSYDCIVGVSGGVDSTYVAYLAKQLGLRPLAVHVDNGWDSELAVSNIEKVLNKLNIDLYTYVIDWEVFRDLQIAFLKASTVDAELPTDHAIRAVLRRVASRENVRYLVNGRNLSSEGLLPWGWSYSPLDWKYIKSVHATYGTHKLGSYPHLSLSNLLYSVSVQRIQNMSILNYTSFNKAEARKILIDELGWVDYGGKHYESIYTRFFQGYILPRKFNIDKRKAHLSSLVCTNQMSREEALEELEQPPLPAEQAEEDKEYVLKKLGLAGSDFDAIMANPARSYREFPNHADLLLIHQSKHTRQMIKLMKRFRLLPKEFARAA